jgi:uncharacterized protein (TIGR03086 family)
MLPTPVMSHLFKASAGPAGTMRSMTATTTAIARRYARLADAFAAAVAAVPADAWENPAPCEGWTAREVVRHVVDSHDLFLGKVGRPLPGGPSVDDDPAGAFAAARGAVRADLDDPERAAATYDGFFGTISFEDAIDQFLSGDLLVHRWDLGTAAGLDVRLDPPDMRAWRQAAGLFLDAMRGPGAFGPELTPPEGADEQTAFLAFLGRRAW